MQLPVVKKELIEQLRKEINSLEGVRKPIISENHRMVTGPMNSSFPDHLFPTGGIHEFVSRKPEDAAATSGFMAAVMSSLLGKEGFCVWISNKRMLFPPSLKQFGITPDQVIFIDIHREKDLLWSIEETLKCRALTVMVGECKELSLTASRRLQLAVEHSQVTGLLHRYAPGRNNAIAAIARWSIRQIAAEAADPLPGINRIAWHVSLQKIRNGIPAEWDLEWTNGTFMPVTTPELKAPPLQKRKSG